ncbi:hypothetical protein RDWZM_009998 [Blomia tropicalis]|uniref:Peptidase C1A papain C-terminal domain-containing protein n=1 Tax=Blomia tropicalis TaxID=40697 RepID=A0A9Q0RHA8_BLOTA|nr:hypothetical protein RDWZM_009998 [Blomia tropicalis]
MKIKLILAITLATTFVECYGKEVKLSVKDRIYFKSGRVAIPLQFTTLSDHAINFINYINTTWKAGRNFDESVGERYLRGLMGVAKSMVKPRLPVLKHELSEFEIKNLPDEFDARKEWPKCKTIPEIRDQGSCGSCWAFGAAEAISDRICIASNGRLQPQISAQDLVSCCAYCGNGCFGGFPAAAWHYYAEFGIVSGGLYNSSEGCQPYGVAACEHHQKGPRPQCGELVRTPKCVRKCRDGFNETYFDDKYYGSNAYSIMNNVDQIKKEIMTHGPVEADFEVFSDFVQYKSGVYRRHSDRHLGGHAIRILGWGIENKVPYWLCANSWNSDWGDKGYFKILRGSNECNIENNIHAGTPKIDDDDDN